MQGEEILSQATGQASDATTTTTNNNNNEEEETMPDDDDDSEVVSRLSASFKPFCLKGRNIHIIFVYGTCEQFYACSAAGNDDCDAKIRCTFFRRWRQQRRT